LQRDLDSSNGVVQQYKATDEGRTSSYREGITQVNQLKRTLEGEISRLNDDRVQEKEETLEKMKGQWAEHEANIKQSIKMICQMHLIKCINNVPFKGSPDNTIEICDEFVIFDSKCPANDDLSNFPKYIRLQTETVKKYANQENVKKDIYLVVPTNTIHTLTRTTFNMGDYNVYIITKDSLEPIILSLKRIEDYEFVKQLTPEERDNICRVIGRFAHTTKRKIQIDQFFANQFLELLIKCKDDLPEDILKEVIAYEKAEKLNPPVDKKEKQILIRELQDNNELINSEAAIRGVPIPLNFNEVKRLE
jgi:hypothetical protein